MKHADVKWVYPKGYYVVKCDGTTHIIKATERTLEALYNAGAIQEYEPLKALKVPDLV